MAIPASKSLMSGNSWAKTFPVNLEEPDMSREFAYRFILISSAMILEKRRILPEACFKTRTIERIMIPNYNLENELAKRLKTKIEGLKHAIENGYLDEFAVVVYKKPDEEDVIEVFSFKFKYSGDNHVSVSFGGGLHNEEVHENLLNFKYINLDTTKANFFKIMKILHRYVSKALDDLPENVDASFRVAYTPKTPEGYTPAGFLCHNEYFSINSSKGVAEIGILGGEHHAIQIVGASLLLKANIPDFNKTIASLEESFSIQNNKQKPSDSLKMKAVRRSGRNFGVSAPIVRKTQMNSQS